MLSEEDEYDTCKLGKKVLKDLSNKLDDRDFHEIAPQIEELCDPNGDWVDASDNIMDAPYRDQFIESYSKASKKPKEEVKDTFENMEQITKKRDKKKPLPFLR